MPTYSYKCTECGTAFDIQQAFTDDSLTVCPNCNGKLRKLFSAVGVTFNGSGFYRNDSRASQKSTDGASGKSSDSKSSDSSSSSEKKSTDSKPAASAPSAPAATPTKAAG